MVLLLSSFYGELLFSVSDICSPLSHTCKKLEERIDVIATVIQFDEFRGFAIKFKMQTWNGFSTRVPIRPHFFMENWCSTRLPCLSFTMSAMTRRQNSGRACLGAGRKSWLGIRHKCCSSYMTSSIDFELPFSTILPAYTEVFAISVVIFTACFECHGIIFLLAANIPRLHWSVHQWSSYTSAVKCSTLGKADALV